MATEGITAVVRTAVARTGAADPIIDALSTVEDLPMVATIMAGDSTNYFCVLCTPTCHATLCANLFIMASTNSFKGVQKEGDFKTPKGRSDYVHADNKDHG